MSWPTIGFLSVLVVVNIAFLIGWLSARRTHPLRDGATLSDVLIGFVTDFSTRWASAHSLRPRHFSSCVADPRTSSFRAP